MEKEETAQILMTTFRDIEKSMKQSLIRKFSFRMSPSQGYVLMRLMRGHCKSKTGTDSLRVSELATGLGVSVPAMTQLLTTLEKDGYVRREMDPDDRRAVRVFLSDSGKQLMEPALKELNSLFSGLADHLGEDDTKKLMELLERTNWYITEAGLI